MRIHVTSRHARTSPAARRSIEERLARLERFAPVSEAHVILDRQKNRHVAEILLHVRGKELIAREESADSLMSIEAAAVRLESQLKRLKEKRKTVRMHDGTRPNGDELVGAVRSAARATLPTGKAARSARLVVAEADGDRPRVVPTRGAPGKPLSVDEAAEQLLANAQEFLAFLNAETEQLNVLYRRKDGDLGLIAPRLSTGRKNRV
jgi:putative sigma-54 modulation protein